MADKPPTDPLKVLADTLRSKSGVEWRSGVVVDRRFEYFRGKDFASYFRQHSHKFSQYTHTAGDDEDGQMNEFIVLLIRRGLVLRVDRVYKKPKPGKKRLTKWPKKLVPVQDKSMLTFSEDAFYAWTYDRPASPYLWLGSVLIAVLVLAACLFPLAPYKLKVVVLYTSMGLLMTLVGALLVRGLVAGVTWMAVGRSFWILPNVLSEEVGFKEAFWPLYTLDEAEANTLTNIALRAGFAALAAGIFWVLIAYAPDKGQVGDGARKARDSILDMLNLHDPAQLKLGHNSSSSTHFDNVTRDPGPDIPGTEQGL